MIDKREICRYREKTETGGGQKKSKNEGEWSLELLKFYKLYT